MEPFWGLLLLHYLQANKLACPSFMNDGRIHETPGAETKDNLFNSNSQTVSIVVLVPQASIAIGWHKEDPMMSVCCGLYDSRGDSSLWNWIFYNRRLAYLLFVPEGDTISIMSSYRQIYSSRGTNYFNLLRQFISILENTVQKKRVRRALLVRHEETKEIHGKLSFNRQLISIQTNATVHVFWRN